MDNGDALLNEILANDFAEAIEREENKLAIRDMAAPTPTQRGEAAPDKDNHNQWALGGNGRYIPVGTTAQRLPAAIYTPFATPGSWGLEMMKPASDVIYTLPDMATEAVLDEVNKFWSSEHKYKEHNLLYKRGLILWGPAGSGKTITVKLLMSELVGKDGVVIVAGGIDLTVMCLKAIRRIEPDRKLIVVLEDIDEIINYNGEAKVLSMLDGEDNITNVLNLATTNYPERLGARIINRPSRFDRRVYVGLPGLDARRVYLQKTTNEGLGSDELERWVKDTKDMSIAHLRELVAAVYCLNQPYEDVLERLKAMAKQVQSDDEFKRPAGMGFLSKGN